MAARISAVNITYFEKGTFEVKAVYYNGSLDDCMVHKLK